jgi:hypothetical protein
MGLAIVRAMRPKQKFRFFMTYKGAAGAEVYRHAATYIDRIFEVQSLRTVHFKRTPLSIWSSPLKRSPRRPAVWPNPAAVRREVSDCHGPAK